MTSLADPTSRQPVQYIGDTVPAGGLANDWWWRTTSDPTTEAIELYIAVGDGTWVQSGSLALGTGAAPP